MKRVDILRDNIIDKLMTISNADYLSALYQLMENSSKDRNIVELSEAQVQLLKLSESDIENGHLISQNDLDKMDLKWLKEL